MDYVVSQKKSSALARVVKPTSGLKPKAKDVPRLTISDWALANHFPALRWPIMESLLATQKKIICTQSWTEGLLPFLA